MFPPVPLEINKAQHLTQRFTVSFLSSALSAHFCGLSVTYAEIINVRTHNASDVVICAFAQMI